MSNRFDEYDQECLDIINRVGWMVQGVGAGDRTPGFHYTVGLAAKNLPEIITFGLPYQAGGAILNTVARLALDGKRIEPGSVRSDVIDNYPVEFVKVDDTTKHLTMANRFYGSRRTPVAALQMLWPDARGRFPWDEGFEYGDKVPVLGGRATVAVITADEVDAYRCPGCGNTPYTDGFYACNEAGEDTEPDQSWGGLYRCAGCGAKHRIEG